MIYQTGDMAAFVRVVEAKGFSAAGPALGLTPSAVSKLVTRLETRLGVRLLNRTTRRMSLTDEGREYYERCKRVLADVDAAEAALSARRVAPQGKLRLTAPVVFGRLHVAPVVTAFIVRHPALQVEMLMLDRVVDLIEEGIDAGVRIEGVSADVATGAVLLRNNTTPRAYVFEVLHASNVTIDHLAKIGRAHV